MKVIRVPNSRCREDDHDPTNAECICTWTYPRNPKDKSDEIMSRIAEEDQRVGILNRVSILPNKCTECGGNAPFKRYCGAYVCQQCGAHQGLARCPLCGWNMSSQEDWDEAHAESPEDYED